MSGGGDRASRRRPAAPIGHLELGPGAEFDLIRELLSQLADGARGEGDDCAVLQIPAGTKLLLSVDTSVENVHFRRAWIAPREIGYRATAAALSDLAAAGATPIAILFAVSAPAAWLGDLPAVAAGVGAAAREAGTVVVGGDTTAGRDLVLTLTVAGVSERPLSRAGARPGDHVYVSGRLGGPAAAVRAWTGGAEPDAATRERFVHPIPRLREGRWLAAHGATAAIDVSDGLVADLRHLAAAAAVSLAIELDRVPRWPGVTVLEAASSGEEYELAVTTGNHFDVAAFEQEFGVPLTYVGEVVAGDPGVEARASGVRVAPILGYNHFSASPPLAPERRDIAPR
ncbi:MAG: thiamine-phosphate kinase [Gemmatimonadales bacterium]|jgi:thiamine-monophosphate kinase